MAGREYKGITNGAGAAKLSGTLYAFETINDEDTAKNIMTRTLKQEVLGQATAAFLRHACRGEIESSFANAALDEADIIIVFSRYDRVVYGDFVA